MFDVSAIHFMLGTQRATIFARPTWPEPRMVLASGPRRARSGIGWMFHILLILFERSALLAENAGVDLGLYHRIEIRLIDTLYEAYSFIVILW